MDSLPSAVSVCVCLMAWGGDADHASPREQLWMYSVHLNLKYVLVFPWVFWCLGAKEVKI